MELTLTANQGLNLCGVEKAFYDVHLDQALKALLKGSQLSFTLLSEVEVDEQSNEFNDIVFGDWNVTSSFYDVVLGDLAEQLQISRESATHYFFKSAHLLLVPVDHDLGGLGCFWLPLAQVI
jgi:hypothetical protein